MKRRTFLATALAVAAPVAHGQVDFARVDNSALVFPRDHGSHPAFRTEWWYITGWLRSTTGAEFGVQVTFFRNRPGVAEGLRSAFAARELLFAHAAISDPAQKRLFHDQRSARAGFGLAKASVDTTDVRVNDWSLVLTGDTYAATVNARDFRIALSFRAAQPVLLQGDQGVSRKGPLPQNASRYYSLPQLAAEGSIALGDRNIAVSGKAWLDHEWSSEYLVEGARGWDWLGINFDDGGALMAFRIRGAGDTVVWAGGSMRNAQGRTRVFAPNEIRMTPTRRWRSDKTGIEYPVEFSVQAGDVAITLTPLIDDAELDSRASVGTIYWEGAVRARVAGIETGRGFLELTGYGAVLKL